MSHLNIFVTLLNKKRQTDEIRRCGRDPIYFFKNYVRISHPLKGSIPFETYDFQDECIDAFLKERFVIVNKARQLGLSTVSAAYATWLLLFHRNKEVVVMATKLKIAMNFVRKVRQIVQNLPKWLVLPKIVEDNKQSLVFGFPSNSRIEAIATSTDAGRSEALSLLIVDEAAHVANFEQLWMGLYPTLSCVVGGTKVLARDGFHDIEEYCKERKVGEYFDLSGDIYGKDGFEPLSHGYVSPESNTLKITTARGHQVEITHNHPLWVLDSQVGGKMIKAYELDVGMPLRIQYGMSVYGNDNSLNHPLITELTAELAYLVGGWIAEGWMAENGYNITVSNTDEAFRLKYLTSDVIKGFVPAQNHKLICYSKSVVDAFKAVGCKQEWKCDTKRVPAKIWRASRDIQTSFLRGYFDGDGCVGKNGKVSACSTSRELLSDIQLLLLNMGFFATINEDDFEKKKKMIGVNIIGENKHPIQSVRRSWNLSIPISQSLKFFNEIGFSIERKQARLKNVSKSGSKYVSQISIEGDLGLRLRTIMHESGKRPGWFHKQGCIAFGKKQRFVTRKSLYLFKQILVDNGIVSADNLSFLNEIISENFYWDKIKKIEASHARTYDFTVPKSHTFLQNGILGSNTGGRALIISTPNGVGNWFHKLWVDAQNGTQTGKNIKFHPIELPWYVHPDRDQKWFDTETTNMTDRAIAQELLCDFLASGDTFLAASDIAWVGEMARDPIKREGPQRNVWVWKEPVKDPQVKYIISADVGRGDADFSAFHIICVTLGEVAAEFKGRIRPDKFAVLLDEWGRKYNNALICPERNTYGHHTLVHLIDYLRYPNVYFRDRKFIPLGAYIPPGSAETAGFDTQKNSRSLAMTKFEEVIRNRSLKIYSKRLWHELKTFIIKNSKPQAMSNANDDLIMALAIGIYIFDMSEVDGHMANLLNQGMIAAFGKSTNLHRDMSGNGNEVLPSWTNFVPYFGRGGEIQRPERQRPSEDDPTNTSWLLR